MLVLARSEKDKEFYYSRKSVVRVPSSWSKCQIAETIKALNAYFNLPETETYAAHQVDSYDNVYPSFVARRTGGRISIRRDV